MSKKSFKSQASSSRAVNASFLGGGFGDSTAFSSGFGRSTASSLSYVYEPPDLTTLIEPETVVAFKNLQKKDATTKAKALEDLISSIDGTDQRKHDIEDGFLEAWVHLYPRTSIDNDRRVRQNAQALQGNVAQLSGKRMAKHMPAVVGAWLCGTHDNDKLVARTAEDAFAKVFTSQEKRAGVWKAYQSAILGYCSDSICVETIQTLSDERNTSPDSAQAKHSRVVSSGLMVMTSALDILTAAELSKQSDTWATLLSNEALLQLSSHPDAVVRRSLYRLLAAAATRLGNILDLSALSRYLIQNGLDAEQTGSAADLIHTLLLFTKEHSEIWTTHYDGSGKKSATRRLCKFLKKGVVGASEKHWAQLSNLLQLIPEQVLTGTETEQKDSEKDDPPILVAMRDGASRKENLRPSNENAWNVYLKLSYRLLSANNIGLDKAKICQRFVLPLTNQYLMPVQDSKQWTVTGQQAMVALRAAVLVYKVEISALYRFVTAFSEQTIQDIKISQPEQSKDYTHSQESIAARARRWYSLLGQLTAQSEGEDFSKFIAETVGREIDAAVDLLRSRNGKPYGAASSLESMSERLTGVIESNKSLSNQLKTFLNQNAAGLMETPSGLSILRLIDNLQTPLSLESIYRNCLKSLLKSKDESKRNSMLVSLLAKPWPEDSDLSGLLSASVDESLQSVLHGTSADWAPVQTCIRNQETPSDLVDQVLSITMNRLAVSEETPFSLEGLGVLLSTRSNKLKSILATERGTELLSKLLSLAQHSSNDEIKQKAIRLQMSTEAFLSTADTSKTGANPRLDIIQQSISETGPYALSIYTLVENAFKLINDASNENRSEICEKLLSSTGSWKETLRDYLGTAFDNSLALTNPLGGAVYLISQDEKSSATRTSRKDYDSIGFSAAMRLMVFTATLVKDETVWECLPLVKKTSIFEQLALTAEIVSDQLNVPCQVPLWHSQRADGNDDEPVEMIEARSLIGIILSQAASSADDAAKKMMLNLRNSIEGTSLEAYYSARAYTSFTLDSTEYHGFAPTTDLDSHFSSIRKSQNTIADIVFLATAPESTASLKVFSEVMSDVSGTDLLSDEQTALRRLILLNTLSPSLTDSTEHIPQQRLVFFTKHVVSYLSETQSSNQQILAETLKALNFVAPLIKDLYGEFWEDIVSALPSIISAPTSEPIVLHAVLRLCNTIGSLVKDDASEDLQDTWKEQEQSRSDALMSLLKLQAPVQDAHHQPLKLVNELLARLISRGAKSTTMASDELFPAMASSSVSLQKAAYQVLYERVRQEQEEISMEFAIGDRATPRIPDEILSLLIQVPNAANLISLAGEADLPQDALQYLLSWKLVFAHWQNASYRVQSAYVDCLKEGSYVADLLALIFDVLITRRPANSPANVSKFTVSEYTLGEAENPDADAQWLLAHLYYLALVHAPGLVKGWWRNSCPRALEKRVEEWTAKHLSPAVAVAELAAVAAWPPNPDDTTELEVRTNSKAREVLATYPVDEQHMAIRIVLPAEYPLQPVAVTTVRRVATDERHWNAWLSTASIAANFASSSQGLGCVIDALAAWRKNVVAALKGHSECAICYSVVSAEGQLPAKRCGTCKNQFHGSCLFRWFKSSSSSSCPLCRNMFNYG